MKTRILFLSGIILLFACGCSNNDELSKDGNTPDNVNIPSLSGTQWELTGIVDVEANTLTELEPEECEKCRIIAFDTDTTVLNVDSIKFREARINELFAGRLYIKSLLITDNKLKIFYNAGKNYLLYEPVNEDDDTEPAVYPVNVEITDISLNCLKNDSEILYVINSQEELMQRMSCEIMPPPVDFDKYSLLTVSGRATSGISELTGQLTQTSSYEYVLKIDIKLNDATVAQGWNIAVLTPKLPRNAVIILNKNGNRGETIKNKLTGKWKLIEENDAWDYNLIRPVDYYRVWEFFFDGTVKYYHNSDNADNQLKTYELKSDSLYIYYDNIKDELNTHIYSFRFIDEEKSKIRIEYLQGLLTDIPQPLLWIYERVKE